MTNAEAFCVSRNLQCARGHGAADFAKQLLTEKDLLPSDARRHFVKARSIVPCCRAAGFASSPFHCKIRVCSTNNMVSSVGFDTLLVDQMLTSFIAHSAR